MFLQVAQHFNRRLYTIQKLWEKFELTGSVADRHRRPRNRITTHRQDNHIVFTQVRDRFVPASRTAAQTNGQTGRLISSQTVRRRLRVAGLRCRRPQESGNSNGKTSASSFAMSTSTFTAFACWVEQRSIRGQNKNKDADGGRKGADLPSPRRALSWRVCCRGRPLRWNIHNDVGRHFHAHKNPTCTGSRESKCQALPGWECRPCHNSTYTGKQRDVSCARQCTLSYSPRDIANAPRQPNHSSTVAS